MAQAPNEDRLDAQLDAQQQEAEHLVSVPPIIMTKSQAKGGLAGIAMGAIVGVILGAIIGVVFFNSMFGLVVSILAAGFTGVTAGAISGGIAGSSDDDLEGPGADI